jgi:hypothetical protein
MSRWKAAAIHLSISVTIGLAAALLIFGLWYPPPYSQATGAPELVMLLLGVDLALGPLLTLFVFKAGKKSLKFDLSVIALLQACALVYGLSVVARARPVYVVGAIDRFVLVSANDLDPKDLAEAKPEFRSLPWTGPRLVGIEMPAQGKERTDLMFSSLAGKDVEKFPKYYVAYAQAAPRLLARARTLDAVRQTHPHAAPQLDAWLRTSGRDAAKLLALPVIVRHGDLTMLLDRDTGEALDALPLDIW